MYRISLMKIPEYLPMVKIGKTAWEARMISDAKPGAFVASQFFAKQKAMITSKAKHWKPSTRSQDDPFQKFGQRRRLKSKGPHLP